MFSFHLLRPWFLLLLIPVGILLWRIVLFRGNKNSWQHVCDPKLMKHLLIGNTSAQSKIPLIFLTLGCFIAVFALAGPSWQRIPKPVYSVNQARVLLLDLSSAMNAADIPPSRLLRAKYKIEDILNNSANAQVGLIAFSEEPFLVVPLTHDMSTVRVLLPELAPDMMPVAGSNIGLALKKGAQLLEQAGITGGDILLLTASRVLPEDLEIAKTLHKQGVKISVLVSGKVDNLSNSASNSFIANSQSDMLISALNKQDLEKLAAWGGGRFALLSDDDSDLKAILPDSIKRQMLLSSAERKDDSVLVGEDQGYWFALLLLPLAAIVFRRGWYTEVLR